MVEPQPQETTAPTPDIASLTGDKSMSGLVSGMTDLYRQKAATDTKLSNEFDVSAERDRKVREAAFNAEGVAANNTPKPWDADKQHKKFESDPIEGFGSAGGLFAMVASAFTKAPMENAINGMAGAINSIKDGNEKAYERAFDSFKENVKLADHRFKMQHELYQDALSMSATNATVSNIKFRNAATKFGDSQMLMLAEHGMVKEIYELQASRASANEQAVKAADATTQHTMQQRVLKQEYEEIDKSQLPPEMKEVKKLEAFNRVHAFGSMKNEQQESMATWAWEHRRDNGGMGPTADERASFYDEHFGRGADTQRRANEYIALKEQGYRDAHEGAEAPPDERAKWTAEAASMGRAGHGTGGNANTSLTNAREINKEANDHRDQMRKEHPDWSEDKLNEDRADYYKKLQTKSQSVGANRAQDNRTVRSQIKIAKDTVEQQKEFLKKYSFITGAPGAISRGVEKVGNIAGISSNTDRQAFESNVEKLKLNAAKLLTMTRGRPLAADAARLDSIVKGKGFGDVNKGTMRAMEDYEKILDKIDANLAQEGADESPPPPAASGEKAPKDAPWLKDPVKGHN